jgi:hypothetical protein
MKERKKLIVYFRLKLSKKQDTDEHTLQRTMSDTRDDDQIALKGRLLLGKHYNGPTQWLATRSKGKVKKNHL